MEHKKLYQIFVSSTFTDLKEERKEVADCVINSGNIPNGMERFPATSGKPLGYIYKMIDWSDYYILILGARYGSYDNDLKMSYTEAEYEYARKKGKYILPFCLNGYEKSSSFLEQDDVTKERLIKFHNKIKENHMPAFWEDKHELYKVVATALRNAMDESPQVGWMRADEVEKLDTQTKEIQSLQAKLISSTEYSNQLEEKLNNLMPCGDLDYMSKAIKFTVSLNKKRNRYGGNDTLKQSATLELCWLVLFKLLAEELLGQERNQETLFGLDIHKSISHYNTICNNYDDLVFTQVDINHIKTKFYASGLIALRQATTVVKSVGLFWSLTDTGRNYLASITDEPVSVALDLSIPALGLGSNVKNIASRL